LLLVRNALKVGAKPAEAHTHVAGVLGDLPLGRALRRHGAERGAMRACPAGHTACSWDESTGRPTRRLGRGRRVVADSLLRRLDLLRRAISSRFIVREINRPVKQAGTVDMISRP